MKHKIVMVMLSVAVIASLVIVGCAKPAPAPTPTQLIFAISTQPLSSDYPVQTRIATLGDEAIPAAVTIIAPGGCTAGAEALYTGEAQINNGCTPTIMMVLNGLDLWEGDPHPPILRGLHIRSIADNVVAVRADSGINSMSDLAGKTVFYGNPGTNTNTCMKLAMVALGLDEQIKERVGSAAEGVADMKDRRIDAYVKAARAGVPDASHVDIMVTQELALITFTKAEVDKIQEKYSWLSYRQLPPEFFKGSMEVLGERWVNVDFQQTYCTTDIPEEYAYLWVKHIIENWDQLVALHAVLGTVDPLDYPKWVADLAVGAPFYLHAGAVRAYRELGAEVPELAIPPEMK
jgi:hypothetical protein